MKTVGLIPNQELVSLAQNEDNEFIDIPDGQSVVPLLKIPIPLLTESQKAIPRLEWFDDRVERRWIIEEMDGYELASALRKVWSSKDSFWGEFTEQEQLAIITSEIPGIKLLDRQLVMWSGEVWSDDERVQKGLAGLVLAGILTEERKQTILKK